MASGFLGSNPSLQPFVIQDIRITGKTIGRGAYGSIEEVALPGLVCAAKKIHDFWLDPNQVPSSAIEEASTQFVKECQLMSTLRHPHIVQFLGVCFLPGSRLPSLVMELLLTSLHDLLDPEIQPTLPPESSKPYFPLSLKVSILYDVASGLAYLHGQSPPIIHRDLSARNVLLNSGMVAKIADLGVARILPRIQQRAAATMTKGPGNIVYMPPEAMEDKNNEDEKSMARYGASIDIFSFGVVSIFTLSQSFPENLLAPTYREGRQHKARTELQRRERYMRVIYEELHEEHPLLVMIESCLDFPEDRPSITRVLGLLEEARTEVNGEQSDMNKLELLQTLQTQQENQHKGLRKGFADREASVYTMTQLQSKLIKAEEIIGKQQQQLREKEAQIVQNEERHRQELTKALKHLSQVQEQLDKLHGKLREKEIQRKRAGEVIRERQDQVQMKGTELKEKVLAYTIEGLKGPRGIAVGERGEVVVAEYHGNCVSTIHKNEERMCYGMDGQLSNPNGVAIDKIGNILVADCKNHCIKKFSSSGELISTVGKKGNKKLQFHHPVGLAVTTSQNVLVADWGNHRIQVLNSDLTFSHFFGKKGSKNGELNHPYDIAVDSLGSVHVADSDNNRIQVFNVDGVYLKQYGIEEETLNGPVSIAIDSTSDVIYVGERGSNRLSIFSSLGEYIRSLSCSPIHPFGVAVDKLGMLYISDSRSNSILIFS